jgi:hypothetical protein
MRIVLFPMLHLGTPAFYRDVIARLRDCDLVVAEGVSGQSLVITALTLAYRLPGRSRRLGLAVQEIDFSKLGIPVIYPDITAGQLKRRWRSLPMVQRLVAIFLIPSIALAIRLYGTRRFLAQHWNLEDLPSSQEDLLRNKAPEATELLLDHRDTLLVRALASIHETRKDEPINVAVVYGAAHMPAITREMYGRFGYRPRAAEWVPVFDF